MRRALPVGVAVAVAASAALLTAAPAGATVVVGTYPAVKQPPQSTRGGVYIRGDAGGSRLSVRFDAAADEFVIRDTRRPIGVRRGHDGVARCRTAGPHTARCPNPERSERAAVMTVPLRKGDDLVKAGAGFEAAFAMSGGPGTDLMLGGEGDDLMLGGLGPDEMRGLDGDDQLQGRDGDSLFGGDGRDLLVANLRSRERVLDCGAGVDRIYLDAEDVAPVDCELAG